MRERSEFIHRFFGGNRKIRRARALKPRASGQ
jgi:hypothetical protein